MQVAYDLTLTTHKKSWKYILDDMMLIKSLLLKVGHDLNQKIQTLNFYRINNWCQC